MSFNQRNKLLSLQSLISNRAESRCGCEVCESDVTQTTFPRPTLSFHGFVFERDAAVVSRGE